MYIEIGNWIGKASDRKDGSEREKSPEAMQKNPEFSNPLVWSREPEPFFRIIKPKKTYTINIDSLKLLIE